MKAKTTVKREFDNIEFERQGNHWVFKFKNGNEDIGLTSKEIPSSVVDYGVTIRVEASGTVNFDVEKFEV